MNLSPANDRLGILTALDDHSDAGGSCDFDFLQKFFVWKLAKIFSLKNRLQDRTCRSDAAQ